MLPWLILVFWAGYFLVSVVESSLSSIGPLRSGWLASHRVRGSRSLDRLRSSSDKGTEVLSLLKTIFLGAALIILGVFVVGRWDPNLVWLALAGLGAILIVWVTRVGAKFIARAAAVRIALLFAPIVHFLAGALMHLLNLETVLLRRSSDADTGVAESTKKAVASGFGIPFEDEGGPLDEHEVQMIRGVVRLDKTTSREIMVSRIPPC